MRILMLNNEFPPLGGGTATVNLKLFEHFAQNDDLEIDLVTASQSFASVEHFSDRIRIHRVPVSIQDPHHATAMNLVSYSWKGLRYATMLCNRHAYGLLFSWSGVPAGVMAMRLSSQTGLPFIVRVGGADIPGWERRYRYIYPVLAPVIRLVWKRCHVLIAKATGEREMIQNFCPGQPVMIIENGVDTTMFTPSTERRRTGPLRLLCVARLIQRKGQRTLIEALRILKQEGRTATLDLVGGGDDYKKLMNFVRKRQLTDQIRFLGAIERPNMPECYRKADVFVLPSHNEGMSISMLEAMAASLPVIVTRTPGVQEIIRNNQNGWTFTAGCPDQLVRILRPLCDNPESTVPIGICAHSSVQDRSWAKIADNYKNLFLSLA